MVELISIEMAICYILLLCELHLLWDRPDVVDPLAEDDEDPLGATSGVCTQGLIYVALMDKSWY